VKGRKAMKKEKVEKRDLEIAKEIFVFLAKNGKMKIPQGAPLKGKTSEQKEVFFLSRCKKPYGLRLFPIVDLSPINQP
jgi:hypothetical protein